MWLWIPRDDDVADSANVERDGVCSEGGGAEGGVDGLGRRALWARPAEVVVEVRVRRVAGRGGGVGGEGGAAAERVARKDSIVQRCRSCAIQIEICIGCHRI